MSTNVDVPGSARRARLLAKYARYRHSAKGRERTRRYNRSAAHREASRRWRLSHVRGESSYQLESGGRIRWTNLMKVDPADRREAMRVFPTLDGVSHAGRMLMDLGLNPDVLTDEEAWNRAHARVAKPFSSEHARQFWTKKHRRWETRESQERDTRVEHQQEDE